MGADARMHHVQAIALPPELTQIKMWSEPEGLLVFIGIQGGQNEPAIDRCSGRGCPGNASRCERAGCRWWRSARRGARRKAGRQGREPSGRAGWRRSRHGGWWHGGCRYRRGAGCAWHSLAIEEEIEKADAVTDGASPHCQPFFVLDAD